MASRMRAEADKAGLHIGADFFELGRAGEDKVGRVMNIEPKRRFQFFSFFWFIFFLF
jgi:hypothetical protein